MKQKIIQITAGRGPAECCWVVAQVLKYILNEARQIGLSAEVLQKVAGSQNRTIQSVIVRCSGTEVDRFLNTWIGAIQWIGTSTFRKHHKRKNWFIAIQEIEQTATIELLEKDIRYQTMRSSGPGGQHVNKVSSAVRAIHKPTGTSVVVMESRSQHHNKKVALLRLKEKMQEINTTQLQQAEQSQWEQHLQIQRGNPTRVFKGADFKNEYKDKTFVKQRKQLKKELRDQLNQ